MPAVGASAPHHLAVISFGVGEPPHAGAAKGDLVRVHADAIRRAGVSTDEACFYLANITLALLSSHLLRVMAPYYLQSMTNGGGQHDDAHG